MPGLVKVGKTTRTPEVRARELHGTGVPKPFKVAHSWAVPDSSLNANEKAAHKRLKNYRLDSKREYFKLSPSETIDKLDPIIRTPEVIAAERKKQRDREEKAAKKIEMQAAAIREKISRLEVQLDERLRQQEKLNSNDKDLFLKGSENSEENSSLISRFVNWLLQTYLTFLWPVVIILVLSGLGEVAILYFLFLPLYFFSPLVINLFSADKCAFETDANSTYSDTTSNASVVNAFEKELASLRNQYSSLVRR